MVSRAATPPPPRIAPSAQSNPASGPLILRARTINDTLANSSRFPARLRQLLTSDPRSWIDVSEKHVSVIRDCQEEISRITAAINLLNVSEVIAETQQAAARLPGLLDHFKPKPAYFKTRLEGIRAQLPQLAQRLGLMRTVIPPEIETLGLDCLAIQTVLPDLSDPTATMVADNRARILLTSIQSGKQCQLIADQAEAALLRDASTIDQLLMVLIPNWELARAKS